MKRSHNDVDFSQRTAAPSPDEPEENDLAEQLARDMQRDTALKYLPFWNDPEKRAQFVEGLRAELNGTERPETVRPTEEPSEKMNYDKFFGNPKEMQRHVRRGPGKL